MEYRKTTTPSYVNFYLIAANVIYFLFVEWKGSTEDVECMLQWGAMFKPAIVEGKQYWRLFTAMFMHFGIRHLVNNMLILFVLGDNLERALGKIRYLFFYLTCGVLANVISLLWEIWFPGSRCVVLAVPANRDNISLSSVQMKMKFGKKLMTNWSIFPARKPF